jgi:predicted membrane protein
MEYEILAKLFCDPLSVLHPFTIIPLIGQVLLLISLLQKQPNNLVMKIGIGSLLFLIGFIFIVGLLSLQLTIIISTIPFISLAILSFLEIKRNNKPVL